MMNLAPFNSRLDHLVGRVEIASTAVEGAQLGDALPHAVVNAEAQSLHSAGFVATPNSHPSKRRALIELTLRYRCGKHCLSRAKIAAFFEQLPQLLYALWHVTAHTSLVMLDGALFISELESQASEMCEVVKATSLNCSRQHGLGVLETPVLEVQVCQPGHAVRRVQNHASLKGTYGTSFVTSLESYPGELGEVLGVTLINCSRKHLFGGTEATFSDVQVAQPNGAI